MEKKTLGNFIAILRKAKGMTQQELADMLNVSNKAVSKWECNETSPDILLIPVIAEVLEVSCDDLLRGERIFTKNAEDDTEKHGEKRGDKRGEKQLKFLVDKSIFKYKNISLISVILLFIGLVSMFVSTFGYSKPALGFAIAVSLFFVAIITQIFAMGWLNSKTIANELFEGENGIKNENGDLLKSIYNIKYKYSFWIFFSVLFCTFLLLPPVLFRYYEIEAFFTTSSVLDFNTYLAWIPFFIVVPIAIVFPAKEFYKKLIYKNSENNNKLLFIFDLIQIGLILFVFIAFLSSYLFFTINENGGMGGMNILSYIVIGFITTFLIVVIKTRNKKIIKKMCFLSLRNFVYFVSIIVFVSNSEVDYISKNISFYDSRMILICYILIGIITAIYSLLTKNKKFYVTEQ